jgi:hypothetical protein
MAFDLRPVDPGMSSLGIPTVRDLDAVSALVAEFSIPTQEKTRGVGGEQPKCLATGGVNLSVSTTSVARPKNGLYPKNLFISVYTNSLNSNDIFNFGQKKILLLTHPHQLDEPISSM